MEEVGRELGFEGDAASLRRRDAHDGFGAAGLAGTGSAGGSWAGASTDCSAGAGTDSAATSGVATRSGCGGSSNFDFPDESATERDVFVDTGEVGMEVSGAVEVAGVVSVSAEGVSIGVGVWAWSGMTSVGGGEGGGEGSASAFWTTSSGGRARGEMMMPGAVEGFDGRCDQMTYSGFPPSIVFGDDALAGEEGAEGEATWGERGGDGDECG